MTDNALLSLLHGAIMGFEGEYRFLSNFYGCEVKHGGIVYPSAEHAYQASKSSDPDVRKQIASLSTAAEAKKAGRKIEMYTGFKENKVNIMRNIVFKKFRQNHDLNLLLCQTGNAFLCECNWWHDTFWGVCNGKGRNMMGHILMEVREDCR